jgi:hypothetical protein
MIVSRPFRGPVVVRLGDGRLLTRMLHGADERTEMPICAAMRFLESSSPKRTEHLHAAAPAASGHHFPIALGSGCHS